MSYAYNTFYEQAHIPCIPADDNALAEAGTGQVNIDGKLIQGGFRMDGKCYSGGVTLPNQGYHIAGDARVGPKNVQGPATIFVLTNPENVSYSIQGSATATTTHAARSLRASHL